MMENNFERIKWRSIDRLIDCRQCKWKWIKADDQDGGRRSGRCLNSVRLASGDARFSIISPKHSLASDDFLVPWLRIAWLPHNNFTPFFPAVVWTSFLFLFFDCSCLAKSAKRFCRLILVRIARSNQRASQFAKNFEFEFYALFVSTI